MNQQVANTQIINKKNLLTLILVVTAATVTWASLSHASEEREVTLKDSSVEYNTASMVMKVQGQMPNICTYLPHPELELTAKPNVLALVIKGQTSTGQCAEMVGSNFQLGFDIRSLKFDLANIHMNSEGTYTIVTNNGAMSIEIDFSKVPYTRPFATNVIPRGVIAVENDGRFTVAVDSKLSLTVKSPLIDLKKFVGQEVSLEGHVITSRSPVALMNETTIDRQVLLVTGLSSAPN